VKRYTTRAALPLALLSLIAGCDSPTSGPGPEPDSYAYAAPPKEAVPGGLDAATWRTHLVEDLLPFWTMESAKGMPVGNFPTYRGMDGSVQGKTTRKPRMIGRQVFTYCIGFLLTGDETLLDLARAGTRWLLDHARDPRGGYFADLDETGAQYQDADKTSQDLAYAVMGIAAYYYVTRDPEAEAAVLAARDLLFDKDRYWDANNGRIKDGMNGALTTETYMGEPGSWELVAQLDPVTAFLLLVQPVLSDPARRDQALGDLRALAMRIHDSFWKDGIFWGSTGAVGHYGTMHTDFGHILKSYWALLLIDKRLDDHPLRKFEAESAPVTLKMAYDDALGRWAKAPTSATTVSYGSDWWAYAEADQLAATLSLHDPKWISVVSATSSHFRTDFVDRTRAARELVPSISRGGKWSFNWSDLDTAKCNEWKNGFHGAEHALVMNLFGHWIENTPATLYFALPADKVEAQAAVSQPYTLLGRVTGVEDVRALGGDATRRVVRVSFTELR